MGVMLMAIGGAVAAGSTTGYLMMRSRMRSENHGLGRRDLIANIVFAGLIGFILVALAPRVFSGMREPVWHNGVASVTSPEAINNVIISRDRRPVLVYFYAPWCVPCRVMAPNVDTLAGEGRRVMTVDVDRSPQLAQLYNVRSVPTIFVFRDGAITYSGLGYHSLKTLRRVMR